MAADPDHAASGRIPFWAHQVAELLLGVVLLFEGARTGTHVAVMVAGGVLILFTLVTDGPLAAWPRLPRRAHRVGDVVVGALLAVSPLLLGLDDLLAIVLLEAAAVVMLWLALRGEFRTRRERRHRSPAATEPATAAAPSPVTPGTPEAGGRSTPSVPSARDTGRALGRLRTGGARAVGRAVGKASAERATEKQASAERATEKTASAERATEKTASAERAAELPGRPAERDRGDDPSPE